MDWSKGTCIHTNIKFIYTFIYYIYICIYIWLLYAYRYEYTHITIYIYLCSIWNNYLHRRYKDIYIYIWYIHIMFLISESHGDVKFQCLVWPATMQSACQSSAMETSWNFRGFDFLHVAKTHTEPLNLITSCYEK